MKKESNAKYYEKCINHSYVFLAYSFLFSFVAYAVNFILSVFVIGPEYFLGKERFIPVEIIIIFSVLSAEFCYRRYLKKTDVHSEPAGKTEDNAD